MLAAAAAAATSLAEYSAGFQAVVERASRETGGGPSFQRGRPRNVQFSSFASRFHAL